ncbi:MAG: DEAD/DEAH box helicase [Bdellovibrionales bacterium]
MKFSEIQLHPLLQHNLDKIQFLECTKIQEQGIPLIRKGKDIAGLAQTGTGKTGAFLIPLIDRVLKAMKPEESIQESETLAFNEWKKKHYILVLVPTRELAEQVFENAKKFVEGTGLGCTSVYGGTTYEKQVQALKQGVEFVIATPGRLIDLYKEHVADLGLVRAIVFDEADRMFDMGFKDDMRFILRRVPRERQFLVFSATLNFDVLNTAYEFGADPVEINISRDQPKAENVKDAIIHLGQQDKPQYLLSILKKNEPRQAIIFSNFKHNVEKIARFLNSNGVPAVGISSLLTQGQRNRVMAQFKAENDRNILVATDVAARGLDILGVDMVINFELPDDAENYVHRIGRTGRAGQTGTAFSLVSDRDVDALQRIEDYLKHKIEVAWLEDAELIKDCSPFPRDEDRFKRPSAGRREAGGRRGSERGGGGGRGDRPRRERPQRGSGVSQGAGAAAASGETHRDRQSGRHRVGEPRDPQQVSSHAPQGNGMIREGRPGGGGGRNRRRGSRRRGPGPTQSQSPSQAAGSQRRHEHSRDRGASHQRGGRPGGQKPAAMVASPQGLGSKVSGFIKRLFGGKS